MPMALGNFFRMDCRRRGVQDGEGAGGRTRNTTLVTEQETGDEELLRRVAGGDRSAFALLMRRHASPMLALAQRTTGNAADADDVVQEAFIKVWTQVSAWRPEGGAKFSTWFYRVVLNASLDRCRRKMGQPLDEVEAMADLGPGGFENSVMAQQRRMIVQAMDQVSDKQREALTLFYFGELSAPSAAQVLDVSLSSFESLLFRGKAALKQALKRQGVGSLGEML